MPPEDTAEKAAGMITPKLVFLTQVIIAAMIIIAYVALTITNHDATPLIALLAGQGVGAAVQSRS